MWLLNRDCKHMKAKYSCSVGGACLFCVPSVIPEKKSNND